MDKEPYRGELQKGIRTILISYYDLITPRDLGLSEDNEDTYFVEGSNRQ